jgi:hypothetical protein
MLSTVFRFLSVFFGNFVKTFIIARTYNPGPLEKILVAIRNILAVRITVSTREGRL